MECRGGGCTRFRKHRARRRGRNTAREEREEEEDATRYIIVGSWHSSRTRRSLIHAWNSRESHEATRLRARSHAVGIAGEIYLCFRNFQNIRNYTFYSLKWCLFFFWEQRNQISFRVKMFSDIYFVSFRVEYSRNCRYRVLWNRDAI